MAEVRSSSSGRWFIGILFIALGVAFFLHVNIGRLFAVGWPVLLIGAGASHLFSRAHGYVSGLFLILLGCFFLAINMEWIGWDVFGRYWPIGLVAIGVLILVGSFSAAKRVPDTSPSMGMHVFFSSGRRVITAQGWTGGEASAVFGGMEIDLTGATLAAEGAVLTVSSVFGGVKVFVPADWDVRLEGAPIFGGLADTRARPNALDVTVRPRLTIHGTAVFGGIEVAT
jgi:predicted membrane protein